LHFIVKTKLGELPFSGTIDATGRNVKGSVEFQWQGTGSFIASKTDA
jgi:hypothetical protein